MKSLTELGFQKSLEDATKNFHANIRGPKADAAHRAMLKAMVKLHKFRMGM